MERIKKALEKARRERMAGKSTEPAETPQVDIRPEAEQNIHYTKTRVIHPDPHQLKEKRIISAIGPGQEMDAYRMLRTKVLQRLRQNGWNSFAVTSATAGEGKTLTAINLAISLAMEVNHTVLLVDFDLRRPSIHKYFGFKPEKGISDFITKGEALGNILVNPGIERLVLLPGNQSFINSSEMLSSPKIVSLVEELKTRYPSRIVIFDLPPLLSSDDALAFSPHVDAMLLVIEEGKVTEAELQTAAEITEDMELLGSVLNKSTAHMQDYYS